MKQLKIERKITDRTTDSLSAYLKDVAKEPLLTAEEEIELVKLIKKGDMNARDKLIRGNLRFVISVAKQFSHIGMPLSDIINEGNIGLMKAVEHFDETRGFKFISYAIWWIRQSIIQYMIDNNRIVRVPSNKINLYNKIKNEYYMLEQIKFREPTIEELSLSLKISENVIKDVVMSVDDNNTIDNIDYVNKINTMDIIPNYKDTNPDNNLNNESLKIELDRLFETLSIKERTIIKLIYGIDYPYSMSIREISDRLNISTVRVKQIQNNAIRKLQNIDKSKLLKKYL